jgi:hypothetical protein
MGLLTRDKDQPNPAEERAINAIAERIETTIANCDWRLIRSAGRSRRYKAIGAKHDNDLAIERSVQNRILDERNRARPGRISESVEA